MNGPGAPDRSLAVRTFNSSTAIAAYIAACAVITLIATALMTDYTGKDISGDYRQQ